MGRGPGYWWPNLSPWSAMITICDTGPLLAILDAHDPHHEWASEIFKTLRGPMLTCEAVIVEAAYFLRNAKLDLGPLFSFLERTIMRIEFDLGLSWPRVRTLMDRYEQMDLTDACVVVMTE